jgi:hypothetical protein
VKHVLSRVRYVVQGHTSWGGAKVNFQSQT